MGSGRGLAPPQGMGGTWVQDRFRGPRLSPGLDGGGVQTQTVADGSNWAPTVGRTLKSNFRGDGHGMTGVSQISSSSAAPRAIQSMNAPDATGVSPGQFRGPNAFQNPQVPNLAQIQAEMARRHVGQQLGPANAALSGYMIGQ